MTFVLSTLRHWPALAALLVSTAMIFSTAADQIELPDWLLEFFDAAPEPEPDGGKAVALIPYAPAPDRDDRTPMPYVDLVFGLSDPDLPTKLSGIGPVFWDHSGHGTGALIAPDVVLTTGHLFAKGGRWKGPFGRTQKPPAPSSGRIYLAACGQAYDFKAIDMGSIAPRARLGLDYAIGVLTQPACPEATVLPVATTPDDLDSAADQILLNMGAYRYADLPRYASHPLYAARPTSDRNARYDVFGVRCKATGRDDTGDVPEGSTGIIITDGCDGVPGGSGGPLLVSRDGGESYAIIGVANSYRPNTEYNNYTRIEAAFATHLSRYVDLIDLPEADAGFAPSTSPDATPSPWLPMAGQTSF